MCVCACVCCFCLIDQTATLILTVNNRDDQSHQWKPKAASANWYLQEMLKIQALQKTTQGD